MRSELEIRTKGRIGYRISCAACGKTSLVTLGTESLLTCRECGRHFYAYSYDGIEVQIPAGMIKQDEQLQQARDRIAAFVGMLKENAAKAS